MSLKIRDFIDMENFDVSQTEIFKDYVALLKKEQEVIGNSKIKVLNIEYQTLPNQSTFEPFDKSYRSYSVSKYDYSNFEENSEIIKYSEVA